MTKAVILSICFVACTLSLSARAQDAPAQGAAAQDVRQYTDGPVTEEDYIAVEYGHFEEYVDWLNSIWKPTMEAMKKAGLIIDYKVFMATPKSPDQPNVILWITFKDGQAALDNGVALEDVAKKVIGSTEAQNKARQFRNQYRKVLGTELIRELILK
jgi:L-rhamnose mutarotase